MNAFRYVIIIMLYGSGLYADELSNQRLDSLIVAGVLFPLGQVMRNSERDGDPVIEAYRYMSDSRFFPL